MERENKKFKYPPEVRAYFAQVKRDYRARVKKKVSATASRANRANLAQTPVLQEA